MKKLLFTIILASVYCCNMQAQCRDCFAGGHLFPLGPRDPHRLAASINGSLSQNYIAQNVCGLNYTQATVLTETRTQAYGFNLGGTGFPVTLAISGIPNLYCSSVVKAYLYYGCTFTEATAPATTATITNPYLSNSTIPATMVGTTGDNICWPGNGSAMYRVDVTSIISGNGNYTVNLNGFANAANEVDGVTLIVIYSDVTASYSGSIALYDGDLSNDSGLPETYTAKSFTACGASSGGTAFTLMGDVQASANGGINTEIYNGNSTTFSNNFWNYCAIPVSLTSGQDSAIYNTYANNTGDCYFVGLVGLYWQNTTCVSCVPMVTTMTLTTASTAVTCNANGTASVGVTGAVGPLHYTWSPSGQTTDTATALAPGIYTVNVYDGSTCATDTVTVANHGMALSMASIGANCTYHGSATVTATGGSAPYTYLWTPSGGTNANATGLSAGVYTVTVTDNLGCTIKDSVIIANAYALSVSSSTTPAYTCSATLGTATEVPFGGKMPYTYTWSPGGQTTETATGLSAGTYTVVVYDSNGCTATDTAVVALLYSSLSLSDSISPYYCPSAPGMASVLTSGGYPPYTYSWSPGGQTTENATNLSAGTYIVTVTDSKGCSISDSILVSSGSVSLNTVGSPLSISPGDSTFIYATCNLPATYSWAPSASVTNPGSQFSYAKPSVTTIYTVTATTACGNYTDTITITVGGCANPYTENICIVTVDTATNRDKIIWGRFNSPPTGFYNVYKENSSFAFSMIVTQPLDSLSDYIDTSSRPGQGPCTYELSTLDSCGESVLSPPHTSIFLTDSAGLNVNILNWTAYVGFTPSQYIIFRGLTLNTLVKIDSVPSSVLTYRDTLPPPLSIYLVEAVNPSGPCIPTHRVNGSEPGSVSMSNRRRLKNPTGISVLNNSITNLNIYPNPGNGMFTLSYTMPENGNIRINIVDELGQIVYDNTIQKNAGKVNEQLNLENLAEGIYSLRMQTANGITVRKLVIIRNR